MLLLPLLVALVAAAQPALPPLAAETLAGQELHLPQDLGAERTIVFVAFSRAHQQDMDTWLAVVDRTGAVQVSWRGPMTNETEQALRAQVAAEPAE